MSVARCSRRSRFRRDEVYGRSPKVFGRYLTSVSPFSFANRARSILRPRRQNTNCICKSSPSYGDSLGCNCLIKPTNHAGKLTFKNFVGTSPSACPCEDWQSVKIILIDGQVLDQVRLDPVEPLLLL